jgi:uroporphyrinogen III methyltransferase/synthase
MKKGKVYLVGAGPGDPGLLTIKARDLLERADAVVYDFLASPALLAHAPATAEMIYVGKKGSDHTLTQERINQLIVRLAQEARTWSGSRRRPFIFGRGGVGGRRADRSRTAVRGGAGRDLGHRGSGLRRHPPDHRSHTSTVALIPATKTRKRTIPPSTGTKSPPASAPWSF